MSTSETHEDVSVSENEAGTLGEAEVLAEHVRAELRRTEQSFRMGVAVIVLLCLGMTAYFHWMKGQVAEILEPSDLAHFAVSEVSRTIPAGREALEKSLEEAAPELIRTAMETVLDEAIPKLRSEGERMLTIQAADLINVTAKAASDIFEEVVKAKASELAEHKDAGPGLYTSEAFVADLGATIHTRIGSGLDGRLRDREDAIAASAQALKNVNAHLEQLADTESTDRRDRLTRRFVTSWWTFLQTSDVGHGEAFQVIADEGKGG